MGALQSRRFSQTPALPQVQVMSKSPKNVLVTNISVRGIGSALAASFQKRNFKVLAAIRTPSKIEQLRSLPGIESSSSTSRRLSGCRAHVRDTYTGKKTAMLSSHGNSTSISAYLCCRSDIQLPKVAPKKPSFSPRDSSGNEWAENLLNMGRIEQP